MKKYNIGIGLVLAAISIATLFGASQLKAMDGPMTPATWPRMLAVVLLVLSILLILQKPENEDAPFDLKSPGIKRVLIACVILAVFCVLCKLFGLFVSSAFMIIAVMWLMGVRSWKVMLVLTACVLVSIYVVFSVLLHLPLPQGTVF